MSAISLGTEVSGNSTTDGTTHVSASFNPTATQNLVLIVNHHSHGTAAGAMTAPTGTCLGSLNQVASLALDATRRLDIWLGVTTATTSAITFHYAETATAAVWTIQEFLNVDLNRGVNNLISGLVANLAQNSGISTTPSTASRAVQHPANAMVGIFAHGSNVTSTPEAGWTEINDDSQAAPAVGIAINWRIGTDTTPSTTFSSSTTWIAYSLELWGADASGNWSALETFTKADGALWGDDQVWSSAPIGSTTTLTNRASSSGTTYASNLMANDSSTSNHEARVQATTMELSGSSNVGVRLRGHTSTREAYEFIRVGATTLGAFNVLLRYRNDLATDSGAYSNIAGPVTVARASLTTSEQLYMTVVGSTITCYLDGVQVLAATDTRLTARNRGGLVVRGSGTNTTFADNFQFGDIGKTNSPKAFAGKADTSSKAKATSNWFKKLTAKGATADQAFAVLSSRIARFTARSGNVSSARATVFSAQVEGFTVARKLIPKIPTASSAKADLTAHQKMMATKIPSSTYSGGVFHPVFLDVKKGSQGSTVPNVSNAKATLIRGVTNSVLVFQSDGITAHFAGGITALTATVPNASNLIVHSYIYFEATVPTVANLTVTQWTPPPGVGGFFTCPINPYENPTTCAHRQPGDKLFRHYKPRPVGRNVYIWSDGTVSESDPDGYSHIWREADRTSDTLTDAVHVLRIFWGGHDGEQVSGAEAALLASAGYTVRGFSLAVPLSGTAGTASGIRSDFANV